MDKQLEEASKFLEDHPLINEVELTDAFGNKVRLVRNIPVVTYYYPSYQYQPSYQPQHY